MAEARGRDAERAAGRAHVDAAVEEARAVRAVFFARLRAVDPSLVEDFWTFCDAWAKTMKPVQADLAKAIAANQASIRALRGDHDALADQIGGSDG